MQEKDIWIKLNSFNLPRSRDLKNSGKYGSGLSRRWALFTAWAFGFKRHLILHRVQFKIRFNILFGGFHGRNRHIESYSPLKPTKVSFIFIGPNSLSRAEDLAAVNHVTQVVVELGRRLGLKVGFKELRLEPKFSNHGLRIKICSLMVD